MSVIAIKSSELRRPSPSISLFLYFSIPASSVHSRKTRSGMGAIGARGHWAS